MDTRKLTDILRATIDPAQRQQAEEQLAQIQKIIGFAPSLLQVIMLPEVDMPVRQAGAIYLKNLITDHWTEKEVEPGAPLHFTLHEQDRSMIRDSIVDAIVIAPELIRLQLSVCVGAMVKRDFPSRWTQIVDKISIYLQNQDVMAWSGALVCLYQLVKVFEYKKAQERVPLHDAMNLLLPLMYGLCVQLLPDESEQSVSLQKLILKIYFALTQYVLPLQLITKEVFSQWMEILREIINRGVPAFTNNTIDEDERPDLVWWKCKKWAMHIISRMFERYGSPGNVEKEYKEFSEWYLKTFSGGILEVLMKLLDQYIRKIYISPRVLQQTLNYLNLAVKHGYSWKYLKSHMFPIIQDVIFPLMSYSAADAELWDSDPREYIRVKFDIFEDFVSPVNAAASILLTACKRRKGMLDSTMGLVMQVLTSPAAEPRQKDGALHMVGTVMEILSKKSPYKEQLEQMIVQYVLPEFQSPHGHMRARACWVLHYCNEMKFKSEANLVLATELVTKALLRDSDLPVKVEAAVALQMLLNNQETVEPLLEPQVKEITLEILVIIRETENEELTGVMQKFFCTYGENLAPIAYQICEHLVTTFSMVLETDEGTDEKAITAMGLLNTIETLLTAMEDQPEIMTRLQPLVIAVIGHIFSKSVMEFYEEALNLVADLTSKAISPEMWKVFQLMYQVFEKDGFDYFTDMMPALHNYVVVDTPAFLANQHNVLAMFNMCKQIFTGDAGEDPECHAAKLLEVIILQCKGQIDYSIPSFVELVLQRLIREVKTSELRTMCLQVVIAALYYNPQLLFETMDKLSASMSSKEPLSSHFIKQWLLDADCFLGLHDRKLCVIGLCTLLSLGPNRPTAVHEVAGQILPCLILLFEGLKRAYMVKAQENQEEEEEEYEDDSDAEEVLSTDDDEVEENHFAYLERIQEKVNKGKDKLNAPLAVNASIQEMASDEEDDDDDDEFAPLEETALENYTTPLDEDNCEIDEYVMFKQVLQSLQVNDPVWYNALTSHLTSEQQTALSEVLLLADQRKAAAESKKIEQSGGYNFVNQTVPTSFNFGGKPLGR